MPSAPGRLIYGGAAACGRMKVYFKEQHKKVTAPARDMLVCDFVCFCVFNDFVCIIRILFRLNLLFHFQAQLAD